MFPVKLDRYVTSNAGNTYLDDLIAALQTARSQWGNLYVALDNAGMAVGIVCDPPLLAVRVEDQGTDDTRPVALLEWGL